MSLPWLKGLLLIISCIAALTSAQEIALASSLFKLEWYGPQMATWEQPEEISRTNYGTKMLMVFKKIEHQLYTPLLTFSAEGVKPSWGPDSYNYGITHVGNLDLFQLNTTTMNRNGEIIDFAEYSQMEPQASEALAHKYQNNNYTIYEVLLTNIRKTKRPIPTEPNDPSSPAQPCAPFSMIFQYGPAEYLTSKQYNVDGWATLDTPVTFLRCGHFAMNTVYPTLSPAQGGTALNFTGSNIPLFTPPMSDLEGSSVTGLDVIWPTEFPLPLKPIIKFTVALNEIETEIDGYSTEVVYHQHQFGDVLTWSGDRLTSISAPQLLNDTVTLNVSMEISFNRQQWYPIPMELTVFDPSRISYHQVLTIEEMKYSNVLWAGKPRKWTGNEQHILLAVGDSPQDTNKLWMPVPAHGEPEVPQGTPIRCGSAIRLQHLRTMRNLHGSTEDSPTIHQLDTSTFGANGHGNTGDDWILECENNLQHEYPLHWATFSWNRRFHRERYNYVKQNINRYWRTANGFKLCHKNSKKCLTFPNLEISPALCPLCKDMGYHAVTMNHGQQGDNQRWRVTSVVDVPAECPPVHSHAGREMLSKRWKVYGRNFQQNDIVAWRARQPYNDGVWYNVPACEVHGELRIGKVVQFFEEPAIVQVVEYELERGIFESTQRYQQPLNPSYHTLQAIHVHGPLVHSWECSVLGNCERVKVYIELTKEHMQLID